MCVASGPSGTGSAKPCGRIPWQRPYAKPWRRRALQGQCCRFPGVYTGVVEEGTMSKNPTYPAAAVPYLMIRGATEALDFYKRAFGAEEKMWFPMPDGKIG